MIASSVMKGVINMTYKQIEASRELRLWIGQVIVPAAVGVATILTLHPELKEKAKDKFVDVKNKFKN